MMLDCFSASVAILSLLAVWGESNLLSMEACLVVNSDTRFDNPRDEVRLVAPSKSFRGQGFWSAWLSLS